jgi:hypothetical protein
VCFVFAPDPNLAKPLSAVGDIHLLFICMINHGAHTKFGFVAAQVIDDANHDLRLRILQFVTGTQRV